jgi:hypothetical protein
MIEHGITTSTADFWLHFHPMQENKEDIWEPSLYWYHRETCLEYIETHRLELIDGRSKDANKTVTGAGYLIPKNSSFVRRVVLPKPCIKPVEWWANLTDRQAGIRGQELIEVLAKRHIIDLPQRSAFGSLQSREEQLSGRDFRVRLSLETTYEIKTERVISSNLFAQRGELGHQVHFTRSGIERITEMDGFQENVASTNVGKRSVERIRTVVLESSLAA